MLPPSQAEKGKKEREKERNIACLGFGKSQAAPCSEQTSLTPYHTAGHISHHPGIAEAGIVPK